MIGAALITGCGVIPGTAGSSHDTVTVMTWAPDGTNATNKPGMPAMAKAFAGWVNAAGGIDGHKLRVLTCNERNDSVAAANCARRAVDENVVAVVGSYSQCGQQFMSPLEAAGIPFLGGYGVSDEEFSSFASYPVNGGQAALLAGNGRQLARNCDRTALVRPDTIAGDDLPPCSTPASRRAAGGPPPTCGRPRTRTDYTQQAQKAREQRRGRRLCDGARSETVRTPSSTPSGGCPTTTGT